MTTATEPRNEPEMMRERTIASIEAKASDLFKAGYVARCIVGGAYEVTTPRVEKYETDCERQTCTCPGKAYHGTCKHLLGLRLLVIQQDSALSEAEAAWNAAEARLAYWCERLDNATCACRREKIDAEILKANADAEERCKAFESLKERLK